MRRTRSKRLVPYLDLDVQTRILASYEHMSKIGVFPKQIVIPLYSLRRKPLSLVKHERDFVVLPAGHMVELKFKNCPEPIIVFEL